MRMGAVSGARDTAAIRIAAESAWERGRRQRGADARDELYGVVDVLGGHEDDRPAGGAEPVEPATVLRHVLPLTVPPPLVLDGHPGLGPGEVDARHETVA